MPQRLTSVNVNRLGRLHRQRIMRISLSAWPVVEPSPSERPGFEELIQIYSGG